MTVRVRVTVIATAAVAVVLVVASVLLVARQRSGLVDQLDESLSVQAEQVASEVEDDESPTLADVDDDRVVVVVDSAGEVVASSGDRDAVVDMPITETDGRDVTLDGDPYRLTSESYDTGSGDGLVLVAGQRDDIDESIAELTGSLAWIIPSTSVLLFAVLWIAVRRTLRPVERIRAEVAAIGVTELDRRVPEPRGNDEIARLAATMNEMLARLQRSVQLQQRFVADASHELRTPLTRMRTELEVDERHPADADPVRTRRSQLDEIGALQRLIEDLLALARGDSAKGAVVAETVDLDDIVLAELRSSGNGVRIDAGAVSAAQVVGDPAALRRVVRNIVDNARRHARSTVTVSLAEIDGTARLTIDDDGPGIAPERRADVFDRFTRLDESRTGASGHAGLGLAIVHDIVARHRGTVTVDDAPGGGARFVVTLPASS